jgi:DNA invertase Pin-like site-specific DNA recombinase
VTTTEPLHTSLYLRISEDRREGAGVERQEKECRELADRLGWEVAAVLTDNDVSAYSGKRRPGYEKLLESIRSGQTEAVICWHADRLHRQPKELEPYIELCDSHGVQNAAVRAGKVDLTTASGQLNARMLRAVAYYESQHKAERIRSAHRQIAENGQWHGGMRPFGYEADGTTVRETEAAEVKRLAAAVIRGQSLRSLAVELNERGVPSVTGVKWTSARLRAMLLRPRLAGLRQHRGKIIGPAVWPPILSRETHDALKAILGDPARRTGGGGGRRGPTPTALGTGLYARRVRHGCAAGCHLPARCGRGDVQCGRQRRRRAGRAEQ